jgi:hypothetical protein
MVSCLLPGAKVWLERRQRLLRGEEALRLQGWPAEVAEDMEFSNSFKMNLAGNSFNAGSVAQWLISLLANVPALNIPAIRVVNFSEHTGMPSGQPDEVFSERSHCAVMKRRLRDLMMEFGHV